MNPVLAAIRAFLAWRRARKTAPIAQARARRAHLIVRERRHHRPVRDLYRQQRADTIRQLRHELHR